MKIQLYNKDSKGKIRTWIGEVTSSMEEAVLTITTGLLDGAKVTKTREYTSGKAGRSAHDQAILELKSKASVKVDKEKYTTDLEKAKEETQADLDMPQPMLAKPYEDKKVTYPCYVQPKLDGVRALVKVTKEGKILKIWSRGGKEIKDCNFECAELTHLAGQVCSKLNLNEVILDGEVYVHGLPFEFISGTVRREGTKDKDKLHFYVFDVAHDELKFSDIADILEMPHIGLNSSRILKVKTTRINNIYELFDTHDANVKEGYEGTMIRTLDLKYKYGQRSSSLMKLKSFKEEDLEVVGWVENEHFPGTLSFKLKRGAVEFLGTPMGTTEYRKEIYSNADSFIGKKVVVKYQELTELGTPRFPVVKVDPRLLEE